MGNSADLITAVVPTYNRECLVIEALESIKGQSYRPIQVIVVDDGSQDSTRDKVLAWKSMYDNGLDFSVIYIYQNHQGGNFARNNGIQEAKGKYIAFLDSDDLWCPHKLDRQIVKFELDPDVGAVYCGLSQIDDETKEKIGNHKRLYPQGWIFDKMIVHDVTAPTSTYMVRKDVFFKAGLFDVELQARQDWDMWIRVSRYYKILCVEEPLVNFRHHKGPRTASNPQKEIKAYRRILEKYAELREECSISIQREAISAYFRRMGKVHFHYMGKRWLAFIWYAKAVWAWPFVFDNYAALFGLFLPKGFRIIIHRFWNIIFGNTRFAINSH